MDNNLKMILAREKTSQRELAEKLDKSAQQISNWVVGKSSPPLEVALKIAKLLNSTVDEIWYID